MLCFLDSIAGIGPGNGKSYGVVYENQKGTPLPGANVILLNANSRMISGVTTNADGTFEIKYVAGTAQKIQFSFIGMKAVIETLESGKKYEIILKDENIGLEEVVIKGTARPKADFGMLQKDRRDLGNAVSSVDIKTLQTQSVSSIDQMLQGAVPGLQVTFNSGDPGGRGFHPHPGGIFSSPDRAILYGSLTERR